MYTSLMVGDTRLGILNVYAPADVQLRGTFWRTIVDSMGAWIVGGDFNNLEALED